MSNDTFAAQQQRIEQRLADLNEDAQFLMSVRGETPRDEWRARWRDVQQERQDIFIWQETLRSNPDESLRQHIIADAINNSVETAE